MFSYDAVAANLTGLGLGADLDGRSTLLVMGDARNNYRDPGLEVLRRLAGRVRHLYWLNPEPPSIAPTPTPQFTWARWLGKSWVTMSWQLHQRPGAPRG